MFRQYSSCCQYFQGSHQIIIRVVDENRGDTIIVVKGYTALIKNPTVWARLKDHDIVSKLSEKGGINQSKSAVWVDLIEK